MFESYKPVILLFIQHKDSLFFSHFLIAVQFWAIDDIISSWDIFYDLVSNYLESSSAHNPCKKYGRNFSSNSPLYPPNKLGT